MDRSQNVAVELAAQEASTGKRPYDWRRTAIFNADGGIHDILSDVRITRGPRKWWEDKEPTFVKGQGRSFAEAGRGKRTNYTHDHGPADERENASDDGDIESFLPMAEESVAGWLGRLAAEIDLNLPGRQELYQGLRNFCSRYTSASDLPRDTIEKFVRLICLEPEKEAA
jgi:hypothetical protein